MKKYLSELECMDNYFRCVNYLSVAQLYLKDNALLKRKLEMKDIKPRLVGHWGSAPNQNFIYTHLNRMIRKYDLNMVYVSGPGHAGQSMIANTFIEGSYTHFYPEITQDEEGINKLCKRFSFPGGVSSHVSPEVPGSINEGGELGYSLSHAFGAVLDNPDLVVACVIGDGEAETGPLAASWNIIRFINPEKDGVVLPILNLNSYKIASPTVMGRMTDEELTQYFTSLGYYPYIVSGNIPSKMHKSMASVCDLVVAKFSYIKAHPFEVKQYYPMIILRSPKGWTCPKEIDGKTVEGTFRSHQVPLAIENEKDLKILEEWLKSYKPEELFSEDGTVNEYIKKVLPDLNKCMGMNPYANGGVLLKELKKPLLKDYEVKFDKRGTTYESDMMILGSYIRDLIKLNPKNFRIFGPDEALSNRLNSVFEVTNRQWNMKKLPTDDYLASDGRIFDSLLSEHICEGLLEGYLLTGRHGFIHSYESFIRIVDSMVSQTAKWIKMSEEILWRSPISSLNLILTSHCWQQDHNGYTHQDPGFLNHIITKKPQTVRIYLPYDANSLLSAYDHVCSTKNYINVIVASKHKHLQWLTMDETIKHCANGIGEFTWASYYDKTPDIILACAGDTPTLEVIAASTIIRKFTKKVNVKVVNVFDLMKLVPSTSHPHGLTHNEYNELFDKNVHVIFAFHGYANLIHELIYKRDNADKVHVHGYNEEGTITTPFDMRVLNKIDRFNLVLDALKYTKDFKEKDELVLYCNEMLDKNKKHIYTYGKDLKEIDEFNYEGIKNEK